MNICIVDKLSSEDFDSLFKWSDSIFPKEGKGFTWARPSHHVVAKDKGVAIAHVGIAKYCISTDKTIHVIGVGGVVVRPEYQGRGIPLSLFNRLHTEKILDAYKSTFALFCPNRLVPYYQRYGYKVYSEGFSFLQGSECVQTELFDLMFRGPVGLSGTLNIPSCPW